MNDKPVYRIAKWSSTFETAKSRTYSRLNWISVPIGFNSSGYRSLICEFGDRAPLLYGAWVVLAQIAASQPIRGVLMNSKGVGLSCGDLSFCSHFPSIVFDELISWCSRDDVRWLECPSEEDLISLREAASIPGGVPEYALHNRTEHNITEHNITNHEGGLVGLLADLDLEEVRREAAKFKRIYIGDRIIPTQLVWETACLGVAVGNGFLNDLGLALKNGNVRSFKKYINGACRRVCDEHGVAWDFAKELMPGSADVDGEAK